MMMGREKGDAWELKAGEKIKVLFNFIQPIHSHIWFIKNTKNKIKQTWKWIG